MGLTRFKGRDGLDGPVSGAIQTISVGFDDVANNETVVRQIQFPAGMSFEIVQAYVTATVCTSTPVVTIGDTAAGTQVVASVNLATDLGALTIKDGTIDATGLIDIRIVAGAAEAAESVSITLVGYTTTAPTSLRQGTGTTAAGTVSAYR